MTDCTDTIEVLFVDDNVDICYLAKKILEGYSGIKIDFVLSVNDARVARSKKHYDAIICDYQMGDENGIEFLRSIRSVGDEIPFIIYTGHGHEQTILDALNAGVSAYVPKSNNLEFMFLDLKHKIEHSVSRYRYKQNLIKTNHELMMSQADTKAHLELIKKAQDDVNVYLTKLSDAIDMLRVSEEKYRKVFNAIHEAVSITKKKTGEFVSINSAFTEISGYTAEEIIGKTSFEVGIWGDIKDRAKIIEALKRNAEVKDMPVYFITKFGRILCSFSASVIVVKGEDYILNVTRKLNE